MTYLPYIGGALVALAAIAFAAWPVWRVAGSKKARALLMAALALFVLGIGGGIYWMVGEPRLALRDARGLNAEDLGSLVPAYIARLRAHPDDTMGWLNLSRIYMQLRDPDSAAGAMRRALDNARKQNQDSPALYAVYGETLISAANGQVTPQAERAFAVALAGDPANQPARYYMGMAQAQKGDRAGAQAYWKGLLDEVPATSPLHQKLIDLLASLGAPTANVQGPGGAPDINAMVAQLAARLKANPNDPAGWQRLIRAYAVLGDTDKAKAALAAARSSAGADKAALDAQARELKLQ